jgi:carbonic anhydrase
MHTASHFRKMEMVLTMKRTRLSFAILLLVTSVGFAQQTATAAAQHTAHSPNTSPKLSSADKIWSALMEGNRRFVAGQTHSHESVSLLKNLATGQHPDVVVLACSDSRVAPELVFDQKLGDLFVVRTAGNIADAIAVGSIEYAVEHLGSSVFVVLGHTKCGAVRAACSGEQMPTVNLQAIVDKIAPAVSRAKKAGAKGDALIEAAVEENIHQSATDVLASSPVLRHFVEEGKLTVFEAEYQLDTGKVVRLDGGHQVSH